MNEKKQNMGGTGSTNPTLASYREHHSSPVVPTCTVHTHYDSYWSGHPQCVKRRVQRVSKEDSLDFAYCEYQRAGAAGLPGQCTFNADTHVYHIDTYCTFLRPALKFIWPQDKIEAKLTFCLLRLGLCRHCSKHHPT